MLLHKPSIEDKVKTLFDAAEEERTKKRQAVESGEKTVGTLERYSLTIPTRPEVEFIRPLSDENQRLVNQSGLFSRFPLDPDVQTWAQEQFKEIIKAGYC